MIVTPLDLNDGETVVALLRLQRAAYAVEAALIGSDAIPALHEPATTLAACGECFLGAVDDDGTIIGAVSWIRAQAEVDIHRLVVAPAEFRRGIASTLLDALAAAEPDARAFTVQTGAANAPARALYARRGFTVRGTHAVAGIDVVELGSHSLAPHATRA